MESRCQVDGTCNAVTSKSIGKTVPKHFAIKEPALACFLKLLSWRLTNWRFQSCKRKSETKSVSIQILQVEKRSCLCFWIFGSKYVIMAFLFKLPAIFYHTRSCLFRGFSVQAPQEAGGGTVSGSSFHFSHHIHTAERWTTAQIPYKISELSFSPEKMFYLPVFGSIILRISCLFRIRTINTHESHSSIDRWTVWLVTPYKI